MYISSLNRSFIIGAAALLLRGQVAVADGPVCPQRDHGAPLVSVTLFDGPPAQHADLAPDEFRQTSSGGMSSWLVGYIFAAGRTLYVQCDYGVKVPPLVVRPAATVKICRYLTPENGEVSLVCGAK